MTTVNNFQFKNSDHVDNFLGEFNILSVSKIANLIVSINIKEFKSIILPNI